jgi:hypothetical protein
VTVQVRRDKEIYAADGGWIQARWHFTFDQYYDPQQGVAKGRRGAGDAVLQQRGAALSPSSSGLSASGRRADELASRVPGCTALGR